MSRFFCIFSLVLGCCFAHAEPTKSTQYPSVATPRVVVPPENANRALFIGNSFSFFNDGVHNHLGALVRASGEWTRGVHRYRLQTLSGARMSEHKVVINAIADAKSPWPTVVLQGHSNEPIDAKRAADFINSTASYTKKLKARGVQPVLFMTWAYENEPNMTVSLAQSYIKLGNRLDIQVVPVGLAFANARATDPSLQLYTADVLGVTEGRLTYRKDIKHPNRAGTYLAACVFYSAFYQKSPLGLPYYAGLNDETAEMLQSLAWDTVSEFYGWE